MIRQQSKKIVVSIFYQRNVVIKTIQWDLFPLSKRSSFFQEQSKWIDITFFLSQNFCPQTPCSSFPCQNNATCVPNYAKNQYYCDCRPGYGGFFCETGRTRYWQESKNIHTMTMRYIFSDNIHEKVTQFLLVKINAVFK